MAKYVQPIFDVYGVAHFRVAQFDTSVSLPTSTHITNPVGSSIDQPYALVVDSLGSNIVVKSKQLGTMAYATASDYSTTTQMNTAIATAIDAVDTSLVTYTNTAVGAVDTSIVTWADGKFVELAGDTMTGLLTLASQGFALDSVTITEIDTSAEGLGVGSDSNIPTSGAVVDAIAKAIVSGVTASNGLYEVGSDVRLGGVLTEDTSIDATGFDLEILGLTTGTTRLAIVTDANGKLYTEQLGTMALETAADYSTTSQMNTAINSAVDAVDASLVTYTDTQIASAIDAVDTSLVSYVDSAIDGVDTSIVTWADGKFVELAGDTMTGLLTFANAGFGLDSQTITGIDASAEGLGVGSDSNIPTSGAVLSAISDAIAGGLTTATNGLTEDPAGTVKLGGSLIDSLTDIKANGATAALTISGLATSTLDTPLAVVMDADASALKIRALGSMAWATASDYSTTTQMNTAIASAVDAVDTSLVTYVDSAVGSVDTSIVTWADAKFVELAGDTMTGPLTISSGGFQVTNGDVSISAGGLYVNNDAVINGDLYIDGSLHVTNIETIDVSAAYVHLNTGFEGPTSAVQSGIVIERGTSEEPYVFVFDGSNETFRIGIAAPDGSLYVDASTQAVATREDTPISWGIGFWNNTEKRIDTSTGFSFTPGTGLQLPVAPNQAAELTALTWDGTNVGSRELETTAFTAPGNLTEATSSVLTITGGTDGVLGNISIEVDQADAGNDGYLSSTDWSDFDQKVDQVSDATSPSSSGEGLVADNTTDTVYLKQLVAGSGATLTSDASTVTIEVAGAAGYVSKYATTFNADGSTSFIISNGDTPGTGPFGVTVWEAGEVVQTGVSESGGAITLTWIAASLSGTCDVLITG